MVGCRVVSKVNINNNKIILYLFSLMALILLLLSNWLYHNNPAIYWSIKGIILIDTMILILILIHSMCEKMDVNNNLAYKILSCLGILSYGVYALHGGLIKYIPSLQQNAFLLLVISISLAYVSYRLIEKPALKLKIHSSAASLNK